MSTAETSKLLVMMHGITGAGKSTIAGKVEEEFKHIGVPVILLKTSGIKREQGWSGILRDDPRRHEVYELLRQRIASAFSSYDVVIVDATYGERSWRLPVYDLCVHLGVAVHVLHCVCDDKSEVKRRIRRRKKDQHGSPDSEAGSFKYYRTEKIDLDELLADSFPANLAIQVAVLDTFRAVTNFVTVAPSNLSTQWLRGMIMSALRKRENEFELQAPNKRLQRTADAAR